MSKSASCRWVRPLAGGLCLLILGSGPLTGASLKLATLVPEGSIWDKDLRQLGDRLKRETDGRVGLRIYPGGVAGSESDILRKMRIGQLQAGAITIAGLEGIDPAFTVLGIPLFYDSYDEFLYVLDGLTPELVRRLEDRGYAFLHWGHGGWVRFFSREPVRTVEDLKRQKIYVTAGSDEMVALWKENGFRPVALSPTDIMTGFQTGIIDVVATTPLAALSLQWFRQAAFMNEVGLAPLTGATIVNMRDWKKIAQADREILLRDARATEQQQRTTIPEQDVVAVDEMQKRGLEVTVNEKPVEWNQEAGRLAASMRGKMVPQEIYDRALVLRDEFRKLGAPGDSEGQAGSPEAQRTPESTRGLN